MNHSVASPDRPALEQALVDAVRTVYLEDSVLITDQAHERAVIFQVGRHLAYAVDLWQGPWHVDVEYNRMHDSSLEVVAKTLDATPWYRSGTVVPDLIVHDRSESSAAANVLVLEAKLRPHPVDRASDCAKLAAYLDVLDYQHAVYLEFPTYPAPPRWAWFSAPLDAAAFAESASAGTAPQPMW